MFLNKNKFIPLKNKDLTLYKFGMSYFWEIYRELSDIYMNHMHMEYHGKENEIFSDICDLYNPSPRLAHPIRSFLNGII